MFVWSYPVLWSYMAVREPISTVWFHPCLCCSSSSLLLAWAKGTRTWLASNGCPYLSDLVVFWVCSAPNLPPFFHDVVSCWNSSLRHGLCIDLCLKIHSQVLQWLLFGVKYVILACFPVHSASVKRHVSRMITHFSFIFCFRLTLFEKSDLRGSGNLVLASVHVGYLV